MPDRRWSIEENRGTLSVQLSPDLLAPDVEPLIAAVGEETRAQPAIRDVVIHLPDEPIRKVVVALLEAMAENIRAGGVTVTFDRSDTPRIVEPEDD